MFWGKKRQWRKGCGGRGGGHARFLNEASDNTSQSNQFLVPSATHSRDSGTNEGKAGPFDGMLTFCASSYWKHNSLILPIQNLGYTLESSVAYTIKFWNIFEKTLQAKIFSPVHPFRNRKTTGICGLSWGHWPKLESLSPIGDI